ncbi:hypothetical protein SAMN00768000_3155 [Sulfobacillus thermosulfidooxidans DSM 9293]|uniref:Uncharacterized protein n=1 Tax=Sulfobacillus thermosulfidooxidans (strain DSM 9293 / VKM B-1269 / AT-1) TaxID=929705 RepID=A0A1W1WL23_SULTA|nr:hypothetical protein [Sulfobacillus thermosulfidooxidans]SMC07014.1 hypothetical protein SAMN00768000_3155 [Sulfobacillus thermosulfidooxidans DSM 9293]
MEKMTPNQANSPKNFELVADNTLVAAIPVYNREKTQRMMHPVYGALITVSRESEPDFSVIMPIQPGEYEAAQRLRTLGDLRKWLEERADDDEVAASIWAALQQEVGSLSNHYPVDIRLEKP